MRRFLIIEDGFTTYCIDNELHFLTEDKFLDILCMPHQDKIEVATVNTTLIFCKKVYDESLIKAYRNVFGINGKDIEMEDFNTLFKYGKETE